MENNSSGSTRLTLSLLVLLLVVEALVLLCLAARLETGHTTAGGGLDRYDAFYGQVWTEM